jgi:hypothetical protein
MFKINNIDLSDFKIVVEQFEGIYDFPARIQPTERSWADEDGVEAFVKAQDIRFVQRMFTLGCFMNCDDIFEFQNLLSDLKDVLYGQFTLNTDYGDFDCIMKNDARVEPINSQQKGKFRFTLQLNEVAQLTFGVYPFGANESSTIFSIDKMDLQTKFGIMVEECTGHFDFQRMKTDSLTRYKRESDSVNFREARDINLKCTMFANNILTLKTNFELLQNLLAAEGFRELRIPNVSTVFNVYSKDGFKVNELYKNDNQITARFNLTLREGHSTVYINPIYVLLDTDGTPILTTEGYYIYVSNIS